MNFLLERHSQQDFLVFEIDKSSLLNQKINNLLLFSSLSIIKKAQKYFISQSEALENKEFYIFLIELRKKNNLVFDNPTNNERINSFLKNFYHYEKNFFWQKDLYQKIINSNFEKTQTINFSLFLDSFQPKVFQTEQALIALQHERFANFSTPGSGKTIVSYMSALSLFADQKINLLLVVGPKSAKNAWFEEWKRVGKADSIHADDIFNFADKSFDYINIFHFLPLKKHKLNLIFINIHKFQNLNFTNKLLNLIKDYETLLVIDEVHYLKNFKGSFHQNLIKFSNKLKYVQILTGTPLPRFSTEGFYIVNFLFPDLKNKEGLDLSDFKKIGEKTILGNFKYPTLRQPLIQKFKSLFVRISKKKLIDNKLLPEMKIIKRFIEISATEKLLIELIKRNGKFASKMNFFAPLSEKKPFIVIRQMQASSFPPLLSKPWKDVVEDLTVDDVDDVEKEKTKKKLLDSNFHISIQEEWDNHLKLICKNNNISDFNNFVSLRWIKAKEILEEHKKERIVVWDVFKESMFHFEKYLNRIMPQRRVFLINGSVEASKRDQTIKEFKNSFNGILIASPATIAESVSLHREVDVAIYLYKNYIGSHFMQSKDRIHRLVGADEESKPKTIYFIESEAPSIDQAISQNLEEKETEQNDFID